MVHHLRSHHNIITFGVIFVVVIARAASLFGDSDYFLIFIIFFLYGLSIEALAFVLTPLFDKGRSAGSAGSLATLVLSTLGLLHIYLKTSNGVKWLTGFLSPVALSLALTPALDAYEGLILSPVFWKNFILKCILLCHNEHSSNFELQI